MVDYFKAIKKSYEKRSGATTPASTESGSPFASSATSFPIAGQDLIPSSNAPGNDEIV